MLCNLCFAEPAANHPRWIPPHNGIRRNIFGHDRPGSNNRPSTDPHAGKHNSTMANPHIIFDDDPVSVATWRIPHGRPKYLVQMAVFADERNISRNQNLVAKFGVTLDEASFSKLHMMPEGNVLVG